MTPNITTERQIAQTVIAAPTDIGSTCLEAYEVSADSLFDTPSYYLKAADLEGRPTAFKWCETRQDLASWWMAATGGESLPVGDAFGGGG